MLLNLVRGHPGMQAPWYAGTLVRGRPRPRHKKKPVTHDQKKVSWVTAVKYPTVMPIGLETYTETQHDHRGSEALELEFVLILCCHNRITVVAGPFRLILSFYPGRAEVPVA